MTTLILAILAIIAVSIPVGFVAFTLWFFFRNIPGETDPTKI